MYIIASAIFWCAFCWIGEQPYVPTSSKYNWLDTLPLAGSFVLAVVCFIAAID